MTESVDDAASQWVEDWKAGYGSILYFTDASDAAKDAFKAGALWTRTPTLPADLNESSD